MKLALFGKRTPATERRSCEQLWSHFDNDENNKRAGWRGGAAKACEAQGFAVAASLLLNR